MPNPPAGPVRVPDVVVERPSMEALWQQQEAARLKKLARQRDPVMCESCDWTGSRKFNQDRRFGLDHPYGDCPECGGNLVGI